MKKLAMILVLALSFMNLTIVKAETIDETEFIDVTVTAKFEETDYEGHAKKPTSLGFEKSYQVFTGPMQFDRHTLTEENNYTMHFEGLEKYASYTRYDFYLIDAYKNPELEYYRPNINKVSMTESGEVVFEFVKERTDVYLTLQVGELQNEYSQDCYYGDEEEPPEDDDEFFALYSLDSEDQSETPEIDDLSGAVFELLDENNKTIHSATTDSEGTLVFNNVLYGEYRVKQTSAPKGLKVDESLLDIDVHKEEYADECYGEVNWYNELAPDDPIVEDPEVEDPEVEDPEVEDPEVEDPEVEDPEVEKPEVKKPEVEKPKAEETKVPNTGIATTYSAYILMFLLAALILVVNSFIKLKKTNK